MWLPTDERNMLKIYYLNIKERQKKFGSKPTEERRWSISDDFVSYFDAKNWKMAAKTLEVGNHRSAEATGKEPAQAISQNEFEDMEKGAKKYISVRARISAANAALVERKLINVRPHQNPESSERTGISLTIDGYNLGQRYSAWLTRSGLWFDEYRNHWIWLIVGFLGGIFGALVTRWLTGG